MTMTSAFVKLSGARAEGILRLQMDQGVPFRSSHHYQFVEVPMRDLVTGKAPRRKVKAGEVVVLEAAGVVNPHRCSALIVPNPALATSGWCGYQYLIDSEDEGVIEISFKPEADFDLARVAESWLVRIYAIE